MKSDTLQTIGKMVYLMFKSIKEEGIENTSFETIKANEQWAKDYMIGQRFHYLDSEIIIIGHS